MNFANLMGRPGIIERTLSVSVVLPASTWAAMPIFRTRASGTLSGSLAFAMGLLHSPCGYPNGCFHASTDSALVIANRDVVGHNGDNALLFHIHTVLAHVEAAEPQNPTARVLVRESIPGTFEVGESITPSWTVSRRLLLASWLALEGSCDEPRCLAALRRDPRIEYVEVDSPFFRYPSRASHFSSTNGHWKTNRQKRTF